MATKRPAEGPAGGTSQAKKSKVMTAAPLDIGPAAGEDDLNIKVMMVRNSAVKLSLSTSWALLPFPIRAVQIQNRKLSERLRERNRGREQLEGRVARLEQDQETNLRLDKSGWLTDRLTEY